jgi:hypothetical protein
MRTIAVIIITILVSVSNIQAKSFFAPLDTVKEQKSVVGAFETNFESISFGDLSNKGGVFVRQPESLPLDFSGYKIEVIRVYHEPLNANDEFLQITGGVSVEKIGENTYAYLIGNFNTKKGMIDFLETVIKPKYSDAKAVFYKKGLRVDKF